MPDDLRGRYERLQERIGEACRRSGRRAESVRLVAVTKTHPVQTVQSVIDLGITEIGENRVQEIESKQPLLTGNFTLHLVGHLQTNKVGKALPLVDWIQSVDSAKLVRVIGEKGRGAGSKVRALVQVNTSGEATKSGCLPRECVELCGLAAASGVLELRGLMTIGPLGGSESETRRSFALLRRLGEQCGAVIPNIELSMGMSDDFEWAIEEGSTMIRVGTVLLGKRE